ncbi:MAG: phosphatidylserine decarboxylase [Chloroflexi bacterium]|nr:phosphatidylserine decarboxylase [Chloroflexota bacterium]
MSKLIRILPAIFVVLITLSIILPAPATGVFRDIQDGHRYIYSSIHQPVVQQLVDTVNADLLFHAEFDAALLDQASTSYWYGKTLDDMYTFLDEWVVFTPHIDDARLYMDRFYEFAGAGKGQKLASKDPLRGWLYNYMIAVGEFMDSPASAAAVPWWTGDARINMTDYVVPPGGYQSFNEFFTRSIRPGARPIDSPGDPAVFTSPADSSLMKIADSLTSVTTIGVKGQNLNIREMLGNDPLADDFINGKAILCMLNTTDYHWYHAPVPGRIVSQHQLGGLYYGMDGGWVEYFFQHRRGYFIFDTEKFGRVAMVCVGMFTISSVNFFTHEGQMVNKGDILGNFAYGGSAVILLFQPGRVSFTVPLEGRPVHVNMGQKIAMAVPPVLPIMPVLPVQPVQAATVNTGISTRLPSSSASVAVPPPQAPVALSNIYVQSASLSASKVSPGTPVTVTANVANSGIANGSTNLKLYVNGEEDSSQGVTVESGGSRPVYFTVNRSQPGTYAVYIGGTQAGSFMVGDVVNPNVILYISLSLIFLAFVFGMIKVVRRYSHY